MEKCNQCKYGQARPIEPEEDPFNRRKYYNLCFKCTLLNIIVMYSLKGTGFSRIRPHKHCPFQ